jgi:excisionase family DNA binding protein
MGWHSTSLNVTSCDRALSGGYKEGQDQMSTERVAYTVAEAAQLLGLSTNSGYEAVKRGEIPVIRIGRRIIVPKLAFDRLLENGLPRAADAQTPK